MTLGTKPQLLAGLSWVKTNICGTVSARIAELNGAIQEFNGGRYPIGRYTPVMEKFSETQIEFAGNDIIYLFSDGITDQFAGKYNKKFSKKRLLPHLLNFGNLSLLQQRAQLMLAIESWMDESDNWTISAFLQLPIAQLVAADWKLQQIRS